MSDLGATLTVVDEFLEFWNFTPDQAGEEKDGHWIRRWIQDYRDARHCPVCEEAILKEIFKLLESGAYHNGAALPAGISSPWGPHDTALARQKGGFAI